MRLFSFYFYPAMHLTPFLLANQCKYLHLANSMKACPGGTRTSPCFSALGYHTSSTLRGFFEFWSLLATMKKLLNKYTSAIWAPPFFCRKGLFLRDFFSESEKLCIKTSKILSTRLFLQNIFLRVFSPKKLRGLRNKILNLIERLVQNLY